MTNTELHEVFEKRDYIPKEATDILIEMDTATSDGTHTELSRLLSTLYERLCNNTILVEEVGQRPALPSDIVGWAEKHLGNSTLKVFKESISL